MNDMVVQVFEKLGYKVLRPEIKKEFQGLEIDWIIIDDMEVPDEYFDSECQSPTE